MTDFTVSVGNAQLAGMHAGEGEAILFLHAGVADKRMWLAQLTALAQQYHVIAYDRRGFGETTSPDEPFSHLEDLQQILDYFGLIDITLIGCSQGGRVAVDYALQHDNVKALVLIAPAVSGAPEPEPYGGLIGERLQALDDADEADDLDKVNIIEATLWLDGPLSHAGRAGADLHALFLDMNGMALRHAELSKERQGSSAYRRLAELTLPVKLMWGELDFPHVKTRCQYLAEVLPHAEVQALTGTAHLPSLERPQLVNEGILSFLANL